MIRHGEHLVAESDVEAVLGEHGAVWQVRVLATPDPVSGQEVLACVVPGVQVAEECRAAIAADLVHFCLGRLERFEAPGWVAFVDELPVRAGDGQRQADPGTAAWGDRLIDVRCLKQDTSTAQQPDTDR
ncbi:MAG: hypothetical protein GC151_04025 [Betaproteobacteria bacterium]|nr:hypothetical protein [Betaproteobacteria bacterium]